MQQAVCKGPAQAWCIHPLLASRVLSCRVGSAPFCSRQPPRAAGAGACSGHNCCISLTIRCSTWPCTLWPVPLCNSHTHLLAPTSSYLQHFLGVKPIFTACGPLQLQEEAHTLPEALRALSLRLVPLLLRPQEVQAVLQGSPAQPLLLRPGAACRSLGGSRLPAGACRGASLL